MCGLLLLVANLPIGNVEVPIHMGNPKLMWKSMIIHVDFIIYE
jgi:hypothetical protein